MSTLLCSLHHWNFGTFGVFCFWHWSKISLLERCLLLLQFCLRFLQWKKSLIRLKISSQWWWMSSFPVPFLCLFCSLNWILLFNHAKKSGIFLYLSLFLGLVVCEVWNCISLWKVLGGLGLRGYCFMVLQFACFRFWCSVIDILLWLMVHGKTVYALLCPHVGIWTIENTLWMVCKCFTLAVSMQLFPTTQDA
jgi:hypothetical protein